jgi:hypothetical protein
MVLLPNNQNLLAASGLVNMPFLESIYHSMMDEMMSDMGGGDNIVTFHLFALEQQDNVTQSKPAPQQYNPFFNRVPVPLTNTRNTGTKVTPRDVQYNAQITIGPKKGNDKTGMGDLKANQIQLTVVKEALGHLNDTLSFTARGNRYTIDELRVIGLSTPRYIIVIGTEINEQNSPDADTTINS